MSSDTLFKYQFVGSDFFGPKVLEARIAELQKIWCAKSRSVNGLDRRLRPGIVDQGNARIDRRIEISILIETHTGIEVDVRYDGKIALSVNSVVLSASMHIDESGSAGRVEDF